MQKSELAKTQVQNKNKHQIVFSPFIISKQDYNKLSHQKFIRWLKILLKLVLEFKTNIKNIKKS
jgi:hypothetical protein